MAWTRGHTIGRGSSATVSTATSGGSATISTATSGGSATIFAVKSAELARSETLLRENETFASLGTSPHIVTYKGSDISWESNKFMYNIFLEFAAGGTLTRRGGRLSEPAIAHYTWQIVSGLEYIHSQGYAHCDIKGDNILITNSGAKIADFGCAKRVGSDSPVGGTPAFMAPEAARGEEQGIASDIWSLGCTIVEMASGSSPWPEAADPVAILYRIAFFGESPEIPRWLSGEAKDFLGKCFRRNPQRRWTAGQLLKHSFIERFGSDTKQFRESDSESPTSVLDRCFWSSDEESEAPASQSRVIAEDSARERIRRLSVVSDSWSLDEEWITVRFDDFCGPER